MGFLSKIEAAGYHGYSKSNNALDAEKEGRYPLTKAASLLAKKLNWSVPKARAFLLSIGTKEWHHTSCKYNATDYYDISDETLEDLKDDIKSFQYTATPKPKATIWFKCWNMEREKDIRKWDWKLTNRDGNYCYKLDDVTKKLNELLDQWITKQKTETHATKKRVADETVSKIKEILAEVSKALKGTALGVFARLGGVDTKEICNLLTAIISKLSLTEEEKFYQVQIADLVSFIQDGFGAEDAQDFIDNLD
jgi:hypothetical protein